MQFQRKLAAEGCLVWLLSHGGYADPSAASAAFLPRQMCLYCFLVTRIKGIESSFDWKLDFYSVEIVTFSHFWGNIRTSEMDC